MGLLIGVGNTRPKFAYDYYYGVEWDVTVSSPAVTRIGNTTLHQTLPIQNRMKGCLLANNGTVNKYLNPLTWVGETLDGSNGQVMVEIPEHYRKFETEGNKRRVMISEYPLPGFSLVPLTYIGAYEAAIQRSTNKLCSVVNATTDYRGGDNTAAWDAASNTLLGKPVCNISVTNMRTYARNRNSDLKWNMFTYSNYKNLVWLYIIEYANRNSQLAFNAAVDGNGYKQGGLGYGVSGWDTGSWGAFNNNNPVINCGISNSLGNFSGEVSYTIPHSTPKTVYVNRYRGIENIFGHFYKVLDGCLFDVKTIGDGNTSKVYVCDNPAYWGDTVSNYTYVGSVSRATGHIVDVIFENSGEIFASNTNGSSSTYYCDSFITDISTSSIRQCIISGSLHIAQLDVGFFNIHSNFAVNSGAWMLLGTRLNYIS